MSEIPISAVLPEAKEGSFCNTMLVKTDCPAPNEVELPTQKETYRQKSQSSVSTHRGIETIPNLDFREHLEQSWK